jgi:hypothetical protein
MTKDSYEWSFSDKKKSLTKGTHTKYNVVFYLGDKETTHKNEPSKEVIRKHGFDPSERWPTLCGIRRRGEVEKMPGFCYGAATW